MLKRVGWVRKQNEDFINMKLETLIFEKQGPVGILKINRPKALNAINQEMVDELDRLLDELDVDRDLRCLIITGNHDKSFVAGGDITAMSEMTSEQARDFAKKGQAV